MILRGVAAGRAQVIVVGSGSAGMAAALGAVSEGASVTLLEASDSIGGTTAISGGVVWIAGGPWAGRAGIGDTAEHGIEYLHGLGLGDVDPALSAAYVREGVRVIGEVERTTLLRWHSMRFPDYHAERPGGHGVGRGLEVLPVRIAPEVLSRIRADPYEAPPSTLNEASAGEPGDDEIGRRERLGIVTRGRGLVAGLLQAVLEAGGDVRTGVRALRLATSNGSVTGVEAESGRFDGQVVLASGGFERNASLVRTFLRGPLLAPAGPPSNQGDGLVMGMAVGARLGNMSEAWWAPAMQVEGETIDGAPFFRILFTDCAQPGGLLVDSRGRRFVDESVNYSDFGRAFHGYDAAGYSFPASTSWLVFDARRRSARAFVGDTAWSLGPSEASTSVGSAQPDEPPWLVRADSLEELANRVDLDPAALRGTVERFNEQAERGVDDDFGRGSSVYDRFSQGGAPLRPLGEPPFYALKVLPGALGTKGGLKTDERGRVLRAGADEFVPGLYAAGNVAASPFGFGYPGPGATIGPAVVFGWLAGQAAAS
jgi:3-oxosteroid 1-dehydrogenase